MTSSFESVRRYKSVSSLYSSNMQHKMNSTLTLAWCLATLTTILAANNNGSDVSPSLQTLMNTTTGKPPHAASTPSSRHPSSTTGITNMSPDREELTLFRELFQGYDKRLRPALRKEDNVTVTLGISVNQLIDIDERNQMMRLSVWVRQRWNNPFLRWNASHYGGISVINVNPSDIWKPDLVLYNNVDGGTDGSMAAFKSQIKVSSNGDNLWLSPVILLSSCKIFVKYFPFDEQHCTLKFGSWTYDGFQLDLRAEADEAESEKFVKNGEWDLIRVPCERNVVKYVCCEEPYPDVTYEVQIRRRTLFFFFNMVIPCLVIVGLTILSFYLPPDSGERISLVITNLLAMTVFMLLVADIIPPTSDAVSIISTFYSCCIFEVGIALIGTCVVLKYHFSNPSIHKMPNWLRFVVLHCLGKVFHKKLRGDNTENPLETGSPFEKRKLLRDNGYIETFTPKNEILNQRFSVLERRLSGIATGGKWHADGRSASDERESKGPFTRKDSSDQECNDKSYLTRAITYKQETIANALEKLVEAKEAQDEEGKQRDEWMMAASILDNMFMWIFLLTLAASIVALFFQLPKYD